AAKQATATIPIVVAAGGDIVTLSLVARYTHPGGNITGNNNSPGSLPGKRLELLKQAVPSLSVVGVLYGPNVSPTFEATQAAAPALGLQVVPMEVQGQAPTSDFE